MLENRLPETLDGTELQGNLTVSVSTVARIVNRFERTGEVRLQECLSRRLQSAGHLNTWIFPEESGLYCSTEV